MDGEKPGWGLTVGTDIGQIVPTDEKQTVIGLEGALKAPTTQSRPLAVDPTRPFLQQLAAVLNFPEQRRNTPADAALPVVAPPIYGEYHAHQHTVNVTSTGWVDGLNRDPRTRVSAGFGVRVVRDNQENYVARAWSQVKRFSKRTVHSAGRFRHAGERDDLLELRSDVRPRTHGHVLRTRCARSAARRPRCSTCLKQSTLPPSAVSGAMRRFVRPRGAFSKRIALADAAFTHDGLVRGLADGTLTAAPPKEPAGDLITDTGVVAQLPPVVPVVPGELPWLLRNLWLLAIILILLVLFVGLVLGLPLVALALAVVGAVALIALTRWAANQPGASQPPSIPSGTGSIVDPTAVVEALQHVPTRASFRFVETDPVVVPASAGGTEVVTGTERTSTNVDAVTFTTVTTFTPGTAGADSAQAEAFRLAATKLEQRLTIKATDIKRTPFDVQNANIKLTAAVDPLKSFPRRVTASVKFAFDSQWLLEPEHLVPAMAYPDFDDPDVREAA